MSSPEIPGLPQWAVGADRPGAGSWGLPELGSPGEPPAPDVDPIDDARQRGYEEGFAAGISEARQELEPGREALRRVVGEVRREIGAARQRAESNLYALGTAMARWLMLREVTADPAAVEPLIRKAVALLPVGSTIGIHANPLDVEALSHGLDLEEPDGRSIPVHWIADPSLDRGSFRLVSPERIIDGRVDVALRALYERLAGD